MNIGDLAKITAGIHTGQVGLIVGSKVEKFSESSQLSFEILLNSGKKVLIWSIYVRPLPPSLENR